jgi:hypothetical protein
MRPISELLLALLLISMTAQLAAAQNRPSNSASSVLRYHGNDRYLAWAAVWGDVKREGVYTCEEWKQYATKLFSDADRNRDGFVDAKEFEAIRQAAPMFRDADLGYFDDNRDGRLSRAEFVNKPNPFFAIYDKKGTCRVTLDDITAAEMAADKTMRRRR